MNYLIVALTVLIGAVISTPSEAQSGCRQSCTQLKNSCIKQSGNATYCNSMFSQCMATGTWTWNRHYRGPSLLTNRCRR